MKNFSNVNNNNMNKVEKIMEEKKMKNNFKENRKAEIEAKAIETAKATRKAELEAINPVNIIETMGEVKNNIAHCVRNEEGYSLGTNGGALYQTPVTIGDNLTTIAASSLEELEQLKLDIEAGKQGDGKFHRLVHIGGFPCDCCGNTIEELEADIRAAENYYQAHRFGSVLRDIDVAEQLVDAGYSQNNLEQIKESEIDFLICYDGNYIMDLEGHTVATLEDISSKLSKEDCKIILIERLKTYLTEHFDDFEDKDFDEFDEEYDDE